MGAFSIKSASNPNLILDVDCAYDHDGARLIVWHRFHGRENQRWSFERVDDVQPFSDSCRSYIGSVPVGIYYIGFLEGTVMSANRESTTSIPAPHSAVLGVANRLPPEKRERADLFVGLMTDGPWPHQIWALEAGQRGYRLKNLGIQAYLSYVESGLVFENVEDDTFSVTEWVTVMGPGSYPYLCPSSNMNMTLGMSQRDTYPMVQIRSFRAWGEVLPKGHVFTQWQFDAFDEKFLDVLSYLH